MVRYLHIQNMAFFEDMRWMQETRARFLQCAMGDGTEAPAFGGGQGCSNQNGQEPNGIVSCSGLNSCQYHGPRCLM